MSFVLLPQEPITEQDTSRAGTTAVSEESVG